MNSSFTETELNNVFLINYVDGPRQNAIHSWETVVFKHWKKNYFFENCSTRSNLFLGESFGSIKI